MEVFRLSHADYATLDGLGGMYSSGRWHRKGRPVVYTASSRSLCLLERLVHEDINSLPPLKMMTVWLPETLAIDRRAEEQLPEAWASFPYCRETSEIGDLFLAEKSCCVLQVPSAIVSHEYNFIINPLHPRFSEIKVLDIRDFSYDQRLLSFTR